MKRRFYGPPHLWMKGLKQRVSIIYFCQSLCRLVNAFFMVFGMREMNMGGDMTKRHDSGVKCGSENANRGIHSFVPDRNKTAGRPRIRAGIKINFQLQISSTFFLFSTIPDDSPISESCRKYSWRDGFPKMIRLLLFLNRHRRRNLKIDQPRWDQWRLISEGFYKCSRY